MREIKFRVWDEMLKSYSTDLRCNVMCFFDSSDGMVQYGCVDIAKAFADPPDGQIIEQYAGVHDKNGREIYEGDIVKRPECIRQGVIQFAQGAFGINWDYKDNINPEWIDGQMYGSWGTKSNLRNVNDGILQDYEIIGNIHENPKLLD